MAGAVAPVLLVLVVLEAEGMEEVLTVELEVQALLTQAAEAEEEGMEAMILLALAAPAVRAL